MERMNAFATSLKTVHPVDLAVRIACTCIVIFFISYYIRQMQKGRCKDVQAVTMNGISKRDQTFKHKLRDYYIKSSYNSCATGQFQNDWVNLCALNSVIKQGCRVLDFELYEVNEKAVVATSSSTKFTEKGTYNSIPIQDVIKTIADNAVSYSMFTEHCPNPFDPLILHFRIKSKHLDVYNQLANALTQHLNSKLLGYEYSYENKGQNLGMVPLTSLMGKVIIIVDKIENNHIQGTKMGELVNAIGNSAFVRSLSYHDIAYTPDMDELIEYNKKNMTICSPNLSRKSSNYNSNVVAEYGVQMQCMCFQTNDAHLRAYSTLFNNARAAFLLKPSALRYQVVHVEEPTMPSKEISYGYKTHKTNFYNFNL
jgi:hypothetical protein